MEIKELKDMLDNRLEYFSQVIGDHYQRYSNEPATKGDLNYLAREVFNLVDNSNDEILKYLKQL